MIRNSARILTVLVLSLALASFAVAQRQTGSVAGKTVDSEGLPLPGAIVTLEGPSLMGTLTYTTSDSGDFRFPSVPPGQDYVVTIELPGFNILKRGGIIVSVGKTVSLTITMEEATIEEEVTVVAATPTIDVKSSKVSVNYDSEMIQNVPLRRDFYDVIKTAPGIISEETDFHRSFVSHGGTVRSNQVAMDGMTLNDPSVGTNMVGMPFDVFEEFEFELGAHPAEVGQTEGAYVNIVTKSGGNRFSGMLMAYFYNDSMVKPLIPASEAEAVGLAEPTGYKNWQDYSGTLGGPFIKDKLWFFANVRHTDRTLQAESLISGVVDMPRTEWNTFLKLTFKPTGALQFTGMWSYKNWDAPYLPDFGLGYYQEVTTVPSIDGAKDHSIQFMVNWIPSQNTFFDIRFNYFYDVDPWRFHPDLDPNTPTAYDLVTGAYTGAPRFNEDYTNKYWKAQASATHYADDFLGGDHEFKIGAEYQNADFVWDWYKKNWDYQLLADGDKWSLGYGVGLLYAMTAGAEKGDTAPGTDSWKLSAFIQDSWTIGDRLTLNIGLRYDESHGTVLGGTFLPAGSTSPVLTMLAPNIFREQNIPDEKDIMVWKDFSPRIGAVFDVFGDGTTSIKASWSRYNEVMMSQYFSKMTPVYPDLYGALWIDLNLNKEYDTTDFYQTLYSPLEPENFDLDDLLDPNMKSPYSTEFIVGIEREIFKDFSLGITYTYKNKGRIVEDVDWLRGINPDNGNWVAYTVSEPGWDAEFGTADDADITVYAVKAGAEELRYVFTNPEGAERKYHGVDFIFQKRMANRWQLLGSVTLSKFEGNLGAGYGDTWGFSGGSDSPNWFVNRYGRLDFDRPVQIKLQGTVLLPLDFALSAFYFHFSGEPWGRQLRIYFPPDPAYDAANPPFTEVQAEAPGERRRRSRNNIDMRLEKSFTFGSFGRLGIYLDVVNVLGENWFDINEDPGGWILPDGSFQQWPVYGDHYGANGLRVYKVSARFTF